MQYIVDLQDCSTLPTALRIEAEVRYARTLEHQLGGPEGVVQTFQAWHAANESAANELSRTEAALAVKWPRAAEAANLAGVAKLGDVAGGHFEVRVLNPS